MLPINEAQTRNTQTLSLKVEDAEFNICQQTLWRWQTDRRWPECFEWVWVWPSGGEEMIFVTQAPGHTLTHCAGINHVTQEVTMICFVLLQLIYAPLNLIKDDKWNMKCDNVCSESVRPPFLWPSLAWVRHRHLRGEFWLSNYGWQRTEPGWSKNLMTRADISWGMADVSIPSPASEDKNGKYFMYFVLSLISIKPFDETQNKECR